MSTNNEVTVAPAASLITRSSRESELQTRIIDLCAQARRCVVDSDDTAERATSLAVAIKTNEKALEEDRKSITDPLNGVVKDINGRYKLLAAPIAPALEYLAGRDGQITKWNAEKRRRAEEAQRLERERIERERLEAARIAEEESARLAAEGDLEGAEIAQQQSSAALDEAVYVPEKVKAAPTITRGIVGGSSSAATVGAWKLDGAGAIEKLLQWELANIRAGLGLQALQVNEKELGRLSRLPATETRPIIPGVVFYREEQTRIRG